MIEEILKHKEWIFSGVGLALVAGMIAIFKKISFSRLVKFFSGIWGILRSVARSKKDIVNNINIDLRPRNESFELWLHDLPKSKIWLRGINFNHFDMSIKQITVEFNYGGMNVKSSEFMHDSDIPKSSINDAILIEGDLTGEQADFIAGYDQDPRCRVSIKAILKSPTKEVAYRNSSLEVVTCFLVNEKHRREKILNKGKGQVSV